MPTHIDVKCLPFKQGDVSLYCFAFSAKSLWKILSINQRSDDKAEGYQRVLSPSRVRSIAAYVKARKPLPLSLLVTFTHATVRQGGTILRIENRPDAGWVIDGQHRLAGAHESGADYALPVVAFVGLSVDEQIEQFITVNREAKGVPQSLYLDLLASLPPKAKPGERAKERATDIANELRRDEGSPLFNRIVVMSAPGQGEISLTNFVRKVSPLVLEVKGALQHYSLREQTTILDNYFKSLQNAFPKDFNRHDSVFFRTLGFGALLNALPTFLGICLAQHQAFRVQDATAVWQRITHFDFSSWHKLGSGNAAELLAGNDLRSELDRAFDAEGDGSRIVLG